VQRRRSSGGQPPNSARQRPALIAALNITWRGRGQAVRLQALVRGCAESVGRGQAVDENGGSGQWN
jgi:hypothetical protein